MTTIIANATIVTGNAARDVLYDAAIAVSGDRIVSIGPTGEVRQAYPDVEVVEGRGKAVPLTDESVLFTFFSPDNVELVVKVLDGTRINGHYWVFSGSFGVGPHC